MPLRFHTELQERAVGEFVWGSVTKRRSGVETRFRWGGHVAWDMKGSVGILSHFNLL